MTETTLAFLVGIFVVAIIMYHFINKGLKDKLDVSSKEVDTPTEVVYIDKPVPLYYATFKFYDHQGRRLSIFIEPRGEHKEGKQLATIYIIACSKNDMFSRKEGRRLYESWRMDISNECSPIVDFIEVDKDHLGRDFLAYCRKNFLTKRIVKAGVMATALVDSDNKAQYMGTIKLLEDDIQVISGR